MLLERRTARGTARIAHSTRADGDLSPSTVEGATLAARRQGLVAAPWHATRQVHGRTVVHVDATAETVDPATETRPEADALVTSDIGRVVVVHAGDCVPIGLVHPSGAVAAVHAGWKGLEAGVIGSAAEALRRLAGDGQIEAAVGPHIQAAQYEFGVADLERLVARFGPKLQSTTLAGQPALDLAAGVRAALDEAAVEVVASVDECTAADQASYWSYRARAESGRIGLFAWITSD